MKHHKIAAVQNQKQASAPQWATAEELNQPAVDFAPSPDEVARRAYFSYVNQGSLQGREVQHWLAAEAELIAERNRTRTHGFIHPTPNKDHRPPTAKESAHDHSRNQPRANAENI